MSMLAAAILSCVPALPFYCANIHVGCAGRTTTPTHAFTIRENTAIFDNEDVWTVRSRQDREATILFRDEHRDWIRIEADGRFSLRRYAPDAMMTRGKCLSPE